VSKHGGKEVYAVKEVPYLCRISRFRAPVSCFIQPLDGGVY
jgi:hypothetical protein